jgi:hypothetical protein
MSVSVLRGLVAIAVILPQPRLEAEDLLAPGARLRVTAPNVLGRDDPPGTVLVGTLLALDAQSLTLETKAQQPPHIIPLKDVTRLEVRQRGSRRKNVLIGAAAGAVVLGAVTAASSNNDAFDSGPGFAGGAVLGALVGAGFGAVLPVEKWQAVAPAQPRVSIAPVRGGLRVAVTLGL